MALLRTAVGSFPKPAALRRARWLRAEGEIDDAALRQAEDAALQECVELQRELGLAPPVDGEMRRGDMVTFFAERLEGMEIGGLVRCWGNRYYRAPRIVGELSRTAPITVDDWKAMREVASGEVRATLTGPYTLMSWSFDEHYGSRERCALAMADVIAGEAADLAAAGATEIQIDEPAISARPEEIELAAEALGRVVAAVGGKARTWTHVAYGEHLPVLDGILSLPADVIMLELVNSGFAALEGLEALPQDKLLAGGVVDVVDPAVETADEVRERIERLLGKVPAERLIVAPDAGLRALTPEQARAKLAAMVEAAGSF